MKLTIPCDCEAEEHSVEVDPERGIGTSMGFHSPNVGDKLPCGRALTERDFELFIDRLLEWGVDEG